MSLRFAERMLGEKSNVVKEALKLTAQPDIISFAGGLPAPESFPINEIELASAKLFVEKGTSAVQYNCMEGLPALRNKIAERMTSCHNINCTADEIMITSGSQQGIDMSGRIFLNPGDYVVCESPTYTAAVTTYKNYQANFLAIDTDDEGMIIEDLAAKLATCPNAKLIYVIPNYQNPSGKTWSVERRKALLQYAEQYNIPIVEDNPYGELRYEGEELPSIKSMDTKGLVLYMGSFSKVLCPGFRVGYIISSPEIMDMLCQVKQSTDLQSSTFTQMVIFQYLTDNDIDKHILELRAIYKHKRDLMLGTMEKCFPKEAKFTYPHGGMFTWVELPKEIDTQELFPKAIAKKVAYIPGATFFPNGGVNNCLRMSYSSSSDEQIIKGITALGELFTEAVAALKK
ncbi:MAG: PLP-dependent aminotransferase family protein [Phascolarctobacterium sp.]|nr:PLP-dependent aminotransferase family protein [Phascolarctobacterium sp.]